MSEVLYAKYNSLRAPMYQVTTKIIEENGKKLVVKLPSFDETKSHIETIRANYGKLKDYYKSITVIPYSDYRDGLSFEFLEGKALISDVDLANDEKEALINKLGVLMDRVLDVREEYQLPFEMTESFSDNFPDCTPKEGTPALKLSNLDSILSNFIETEHGLICLDYEWVLDFPVPKDFIRYRVIRYLYVEEAESLSRRFEVRDFLRSFGLEDEDIDLYEKMDDCFQLMVHGENRKYMYLGNYKNPEDKTEGGSEDMNDYEKENKALREEIEALRRELYDQVEATKEKIDIVRDRDDELEEKNDLLNSRLDRINFMEKKMALMKKGIRNPLYGIYVMTKKMPRLKEEEKERLRLEEKRNKEREKRRKEDPRDLYKRRYDQLLSETGGDYMKWIENEESGYEKAEKLSYEPLISVVIQVGDSPEEYLNSCLDSIIDQSYKNREIIIISDSSAPSEIKAYLNSIKKIKSDKNIRVKIGKGTLDTSEMMNIGIKMAKGQFITFVSSKDTLSSFALYEVAKLLNEKSSLDFIYGDEDRLGDDGITRYTPFFKPDWSPDTLMSIDYIAHSGVYRTDLLKKIGGFNPKYDGCHEYDLHLRFTEKTKKIAHISKILYHVKLIGAFPYTGETLTPEEKNTLRLSQRCRKAALRRRDIEGEVEWIGSIRRFRVNYTPKNDPMVSIIIPSKDNPELLEKCLGSLTEKTEYKNYEIIVVDNGSSENNKEKYKKIVDEARAKYIYEPAEFNFSYMCNTGANAAEGDFLLFLNDDIVIKEEKWLGRMVGQAGLPHTGAVGAKLLYPDTKLIQHDGIISIDMGPMHCLMGKDDSEKYQFGRNKLSVNVSGVTAACLMIEKKKFEAVGGFDEEYAVAYNDIDLCFKLLENGYFNVLRNDAVLYHYESVTRGKDALDTTKFERLMDEQDRLYAAHPLFKKHDPNYNINLNQQKGDFTCNFEKDVIYDIIETDNLASYEVDESIKYSVDIADIDWSIYIEGWAFCEGSEDTVFNDTKLVLEGKDRSYIISTGHALREDLPEVLYSEKDVQFSGFKCRLDRKRIKSGTYSFKVLINGKISVISNIEKLSLKSFDVK